MQIEKLTEIKGMNAIFSYMKHPGMARKLSKARLYSLERNALDTLDLSYFFPTEYVDDPLNVGKHYEAKEIMEMFYDINDASKIVQQYDPRDIIVGDVNNSTVIDSSIYNFISSEGLRGMLFENVGENNVLCLGDDTPGKIGDIYMHEEPINCAVKARYRVMLAVSKMPGYVTYTGYAHARHMINF